MKHIKSVDGFVGCYNGLAPKVCGNLLSAIATQKLLDYLEPPKDDEEDFEDEPTEEQKYSTLLIKFKLLFPLNFHLFIYLF